MSSGGPIEGKQEGESPAFRAGKGKHSPPANPERVTAGALERKGNGVHHLKSK